jgi:hypothetical protein
MYKSDFIYSLPKALIAQEPLADRTGSRLMQVGADQHSITHLRFLDLIDLVEDKDITRSIRKALKTVDIALLDHVIIGGNGFFSFKEKNIGVE